MPPGDPDALSEILAELLADPGAREALAQGAAREAATISSWERIGDQTMELYRELLGTSYDGSRLRAPSHNPC